MEVLNQVEILNLRELEDQSDTSLFVLNNTEPRGEIIFNVAMTKGRDYTVIVPDTWVPFDLSTQAKKSEIIDSPDFRRAVTQKYIVVVSTDSADKFMANNEYAQDEVQRIFNKAGGQNAIASNSNTKPVPPASKLEQIKQTASGVPAEEASEAISGAVIQIVTRSNGEGEDKMDVKEAMSLLMGRKLNRKELDYIMKSSTQDTIKAYASKQL